MKLCIFRTVPLSIRSYSLYTQQWYMSYRFVDSFRAAGSRWNSVPSCSKVVYKLVWHIPLLSVQWIIPDGQRNCPKHVKFHFQKKIWEISASSWFCYKEICHDARSQERKNSKGIVYILLMNQCRSILCNMYDYFSCKDKASFVNYLFLTFLTTFWPSHITV
jgi:hypothetical protein